MNSPLLPRDRGNRIANSFWASRFAGIVPGTFGLVCGIEDPPSFRGWLSAIPRNFRRWARCVALISLVCSLFLSRGCDVEHLKPDRLRPALLKFHGKGVVNATS